MPTPLPAAPAVTATPNLNANPGESVEQYEARLGAQSAPAGSGAGFGAPVTPQPVTDLTTAHDEVAKQLGFNSYADALTALSAPSDDTTTFYNNAYSAAGLDTLSTQITSRQNDLASATGKINDNPWLDEASRVGRVKNLEDLANADINNLQNEYNTKLQSVHDLVTEHSDELKTTTANNAAKLALLESNAKDLAAEAATKAKDATAAPTTIKGANDETYQWDPTTNSFKQILPGKSAATSGNVTIDTGNGNNVSIPADVAPYYSTSNSGVGYVDASALQGTAADKASIIKQATAAGLKVITNKNEAADLTNIDDANSKLDTISQIMAGIDQPDVLSRLFNNIGFTQGSVLLQTNPQRAAAGALQAVGLDILKAISGVQGFRGNATVIQQINDHLPSIYDTADTVNTKIDFIRQLISDREDSILGTSNSSKSGSTYNGITIPGTSNAGSTYSGITLPH